jgi:large subunit ribosomal protein L46
MNTWIVGYAPVGYYKPQAKVITSPDSPIEKTFFMKGRILAGQADLTGNQFGWKDFMWLTKQEMEKRFDRKFFDAIKNTMSDR